MTVLSRGLPSGVGFQTRALTLAAAERFANCLRCNAQYREVTVQPHPRTAGKFQVSYEPTNPARIEKLRQAAQGTREQRAAAQAHCYELRPLANGNTEVLNLLSGAVYTVMTAGQCDCRDAQHRCAGAAILCKHGIMVRNHGHQAREAQHLSNLPPAAVIAVSRPVPSADEIARRMARDFPAEEW